MPTFPAYGAAPVAGMADPRYSPYGAMPTAATAPGGALPPGWESANDPATGNTQLRFGTLSNYCAYNTRVSGEV